MRYSLLILTAAVSLCLADGPPDGASKTKLPQIRKEHEDKHDKEGRVVASVDTIYRGEQRILLTVTLTTNKYGLRMSRSYFIDGKTVLDDFSYADGTRKIRLWKNDVLYDEFKQTVDGSTEPVKSEELVAPTELQKELPEDGHRTLHRCKIVLTKMQVLSEAHSRVVKVAAEMLNEGNEPFFFDDSSLGAAVHGARFTGTSGLRYEFDQPITIGEESFGVTGDRLLSPKSTNSVSLVISTTKDAFKLINKDLIADALQTNKPTNLTYDVFGVLESAARGEGHLREMLISAFGKIDVNWPATEKK